ncbi:MAG: MarR family transcriptional regulator [Acidimicrobiales bacterium]
MTEPGPADLDIPALLRGARGTYAQSIRAQLQAIGIDDLPRNGVFLLAGIDSADQSQSDLATGIGVTKQAVSQLIDTLVNRGYLRRSLDADDRRRISLELTERGRQVLEAAKRGAHAVDLQLLERVLPEQVEAMCTALGALAEIRRADIETGAGVPRASRQFRHFSPVFPVRDLGAALEHYASLGFHTLAYEPGGHYGFANRDGVGIHLCVEDEGDDGHGHHHHASAYLYVRDADALYAEWSRPGIGGTTHPVQATDYQLREGTHFDPDGNLIRFGSPMET